MFNSLPLLTRGLSFGKIIGGISKTLSVANQIIPLYMKAKPIISNARNTLGILKEMTKSSAKPKEEIKENNIPNEPKIENVTYTKKEENQPIFFL